MIAVALLAAAAMVVKDILMTLLVQAEARNRALLAGLLDMLGDAANFTTVTIGVTVLQGHSLSGKALVMSLVLAASFAATFTGVKIGKRFIKEARHEP